jgi:hypothetical protein
LGDTLLYGHAKFEGKKKGPTHSEFSVSANFEEAMSIQNRKSVELSVRSSVRPQSLSNEDQTFLTRGRGHPIGPAFESDRIYLDAAEAIRKLSSILRRAYYKELLVYVLFLVTWFVLLGVLVMVNTPFLQNQSAVELLFTKEFPPEQSHVKKTFSDIGQEDVSNVSTLSHSHSPNLTTVLHNISSPFLFKFCDSNLSSRSSLLSSLSLSLLSSRFNPDCLNSKNAHTNKQEVWGYFEGTLTEGLFNQDWAVPRNICISSPTNTPIRKCVCGGPSNICRFDDSAPPDTCEFNEQFLNLQNRLVGPIRFRQIRYERTFRHFRCIAFFPSHPHFSLSFGVV